MPRPIAVITERVRERVRRDGVDLGADSAAADRYVRDEVRRYSERALGGAAPLLGDERAAERQIVASLTGFGALQPYFDDPDVEELWINAPDRVFIARNGVTERSPIELTDSEVRDLVERMLQSSGRPMPYFQACTLPCTCVSAKTGPASRLLLTGSVPNAWSLSSA